MSLVVLTNIPTPCRTAFFDALAEAAACAGKRFHVLYCAKTEQGRHWPYEPAKMKHAHTVLRGFHPSLTGMRAHLNPGVLAELNLLKPDALVVAGPWSTPTILLAGLNLYSPPPRRFYLFDAEVKADETRFSPIAWLRRQAYRRYDEVIATSALAVESAKAHAGDESPIASLTGTKDSSGLAKAILSHIYPSRL